MPLAPGTRLGPYEILSPLGAGGMGEVYRAQDSRLGREVAIKVLPAELASDGDRLKRFEKEARSASALNHPNIVTVHDVGTTNGISWIAMERVDGQTLRKLLAGGAIPLKKLLGTAAQIAEGLAKAHSTGIVHRDLKPENVMVTKEGVVKILDFGLAKLSRQDSSSGEFTQTATVSAGTEAGVVLGTVGYMSPEQALGEPLDFRSDQFSLGSILYEMATGKRAFARASAPEILAAIIREEPATLSSAAPATPPALRWIVERCLAKDPEERYASTRDLARDLARLRDGVSEGTLSGAAIAGPAARHRSRRGLAVAAAALVAGVAIGVAATRRPREAPLLYRPVTFHRGSLGTARFGPDEKTIVYAAAWQGRPVQLYSTRSDSTESTALPLPSADLASVSSTGKLAIVIGPRDQPGVIAEVSLAGGAPRELIESEHVGRMGFSLDVAPADWAPGGDRLAVVRRGQLEFPIGNVLVPRQGGHRILSPRFSPDGQLIAFIQDGTGLAAIGVVDLAGKARILSDGWEIVTSLAWHPGTGEIWFSGRENTNAFGVVDLHAVSLAGAHRVVARTPQLLIVEDIARDGRVLARSDDWPTTMMCLPPGASREVDLSWLDFSVGMDLSEDGRDLLFSEGGSGAGAKGAVYVRKTDGSSAAVRLGEGWGDQALSPDKKWALQVSSDRRHLILLPVGPGESKTIQDEGLQYRTATWFPDGKRLLVEASAPGHGPRLYVRDLSGGPPRPFTSEGFWGARVSPDGKLVIAADTNGKYFLCPVDGSEPRLLPGQKPEDAVLRFDAKGESLFVASSGLPLRIDRVDIASGRRSLWKEIALADPTGVDNIFTVQITADGKSYCYSFMRGLSRLYVVEGLR